MNLAVSQGRRPTEQLDWASFTAKTAFPTRSAHNHGLRKSSAQIG